MDAKVAKVELMAEPEFSAPVDYYMEKLNNALEDSNKLYQNLKTVNKEGYLYREMTIKKDSDTDDVFYRNVFFDMINSLQKGEKFTMDYTPMCAGGIDICKQYAGNAMLKSMNFLKVIFCNEIEKTALNLTIFFFQLLYFI